MRPRSPGHPLRHRAAPTRHRARAGAGTSLAREHGQRFPRSSRRPMHQRPCAGTAPLPPRHGRPPARSDQPRTPPSSHAACGAVTPCFPLCSSTSSYGVSGDQALQAGSRHAFLRTDSIPAINASRNPCLKEGPKAARTSVVAFAVMLRHSVDAPWQNSFA